MDPSTDQPGDFESLRGFARVRIAHPGLRLEVELLRADERMAIVRAQVTTPAGDHVGAIGAVDGSGAASTEQAERRAIRLALERLGIDIDESVVVAGLTAEPVSPIASGAVESLATEQVAPPSPPDERKPSPAPLDEDPPLEDYSWTAFWKWGRTLGYDNKAQLQESLGRSIEGLSPADVRMLMRDKLGTA